LLTENLFDGEKTRTERVTIQEDAGTELPGQLNLGFGVDDVNSHDVIFPVSLGGGYDGKI